MITEQLVRRAQWIPSRFNKFPRFTISQTYPKANEIEDIYNKMRLFISLNPHIINFLDQHQPTPEMQQRMLREELRLPIGGPLSDELAAASEAPQSVQFINVLKSSQK